MHLKKIVPASAAALLLVGLAACSSSGGDSEPPASQPATTDSTAASDGASGGATGAAGDTPDKALKIGYASPVMAQPGQQQFADGLKAAAKLSGSDVTVYDSNVQSDKQITNMQTMLQQKPDVIGTWTLDPGATAGIYGQILAAKIPLLGTNSDDNGIQSSVWQQSTTCDPGGPWEQTAKVIATKYPGGSVITIGLDGVPSIDSNVKCFTDAAQAAGLKVITHVSNTTDDSAGGQKLTADLLTKYPDVNAVWSYNDASALGASAAVTAAGKKVSDGTSDGVIITGNNGDASAIDAIKQGRMTLTWDPNNVEFGWLFMKLAEQAAAGDAPTKLVLKSTMITKDNAGEWVDPSDRTVSFDDLDYTQS